MISAVDLLRKKRKPIDVKPYSKLAVYYDELMSHVDYIRWTKYILQTAFQYKEEIRAILDLACGTGALTTYLTEMGFKVYGADGSPEMIEKARENVTRQGGKIDYFICDLRQTPPVSNIDVVLCLYDSINYLMEKDDLAAMFRAVHQVVDQEGVFIFDCSTMKNSLNHFDGYKITERYLKGIVHRYAYFDPVTCIQHNEFEIYPTDSQELFFEHHQQRIWELTTVGEILEANGFSLKAMLDGYTLSPGSEQSDRVHFVAIPV